MKIHLTKLFALVMLTIVIVSFSQSADIVSAGKKGVWSSDTSWVGNIVPTAGDNVFIADRDTITFDMDTTTIANLTVGSGDSCWLRMSKVKLTKLTVTGSILVNSLGAFSVQTRDTSWHTDLVHKLFIYGDITSYGLFDMRNGSTSTNPQTIGVMNIYFVGSSNSTVNIPGTFTKETKEFNAVTIDKTGGANLLLASNMYISGGSSQAPNCDSYLTFKRGKIITGDYVMSHLGSSSNQVLGMSDTSYIVGAMGRGISNTSAVSKTYPIGDALGYRPFKVGTASVGGQTGHHVIVRAIAGDANTGSSLLNGGIDKISAVRYFKITYRTVIGSTLPPNATIDIGIVAPNYRLDDGIRGGNTNLRVAYSIDERATWTKIGQSVPHTTSFTSLPKQLNCDTIKPYIHLDTLLTAAYVAFADSGNVNPLDGTLAGFSINSHTLSFGSVYLSESKTDSLVITNTGTGALTIRSRSTVDTLNFSGSPATPFVIPVGESRTVYFTFAPIDTGLKTSKVYFYHDAPYNPDSIVVSGTGLYYKNVSLALNAKWNLISVPLLVDNNLKDSLFPSAISSAYKFAGGYQTATNLLNGVGYWLKFDTAETKVMGGKPYLSDSLTVTAGWNIIGSLSNAIPTSSIIGVGTNVVGSFFKYQNGYASVDTLTPGGGYWVKVTDNGKLFLSSEAVALKSGQRSESLNELNSINIKDANENEQTLYFGRSSNKDISSNYQMPPLPPTGIFDARFASQRLAEVAEPSVNTTFPINLSSAVYPITISWEVKNNSQGVTLQSGNKSIAMTGKGSAQVTSSNSHIAVNVSNTNVTPKEFSLNQNYPNPFNPTTNITFALPAQSVVTLKVFNLLGQEVSTLLENAQYVAGVHEVGFNADNITSGIYFYKIQAQQVTGDNDLTGDAIFTSVKRMTLLK